MAPQHTGKTKLEKTAAATATVFNTVELLEGIPLALPTRDLLLVKRVCRTWKATIDTSIRIQHALFLKPISIGHPTVLFIPLLSGLPDTAPWRYHLREEEASTEEFPSLNKMLLCQPAIPRIMIRIRVNLGSTSLTHHSWVENFRGLRMQDVYDKLERTAGNSRLGSRISFVLRPRGSGVISNLGLEELEVLEGN